MAMAIERVRTPHVAEPGPGLWSNCLRHGNQVCIAGLVAVDADFNVLAVGDAAEQSRIVFRNIRHYLEAAGGGLGDVIRMRVYLQNLARDRPAFLAARREFFTGDFPCSTLVEVSALVSPEMLVEVDADAIIGAGRRGGT